MADANSIVTAQLIRSNVLQFVRNREKAYQAVIAQGKQVLHYDQKCAAIKLLYVQIEAAANWDLRAQYTWIHLMRHSITTLLPSENNPDARQVNCRKKMLQLLNHCDAQVNKIRPQLTLL